MILLEALGFVKMLRGQVKQPHKTLLLWVVLIVAFLAIWQFLSPDSVQQQHVPFSEFIALTKAPKDQRHVDEVEIKDREYHVQIKNPASKGSAGARLQPSARRATTSSPSS